MAPPAPGEAPRRAARAGRRPGWLLAAYPLLLGGLLAGYLLFDRAFAYLRVPGTPLFVGEIVLLVGVLGVVCATGHLRNALRREPVLALLGLFAFWGLLRTLPLLGEHGMDAVRDAALWYYCGFAFLIVAAVDQDPGVVGRLLRGMDRFTPWLLGWLPFAIVLIPLAEHAPVVPFTSVSILSHKSGNAGLAALLALACLWLFRDGPDGRRRAAWSFVALVVVLLVATQNRGGLLGAVAGAAVGLAFVRDRWRLVGAASAGITAVMVLAVLLSVSIPVGGLQGREYSAGQLIENVLSLAGSATSGNLSGTVEGRQVLWNRVLEQRIDEQEILQGAGFGPNLASEVGVYDEGADALRSPHNSHLNVLARTGLVGIALWIVLWVTWFRRLVTGCRRLDRQGRRKDHHVAVLCLTITTAVLVSTFFDPQLEGPQVAALLWTTFGIGVVATRRSPSGRGDRAPGTTWQPPR